MRKPMFTRTSTSTKAIARCVNPQTADELYDVDEADFIAGAKILDPDTRKEFNVDIEPTDAEPTDAE